MVDFNLRMLLPDSVAASWVFHEEILTRASAGGGAGGREGREGREGWMVGRYQMAIIKSRVHPFPSVQIHLRAHNHTH